METNSEITREAVEVKQKWGQAIRDQRQAKGMSQSKLAQLVGVDQTAVSWWETGNAAPGIEKQLAIARALGIAPRLLFSFPEAA